MIRKPILLIAFATLYGCSPEPSIPETPLPKKPQPSLPENPKEVEITLWESVDFKYYSTSAILFRSGESRLNRKTSIGEFDVPFQMSRKELMSLYLFLRENGFAQLSTQKVPPYKSPSGGGVSYIILRVDGKTYKSYKYHGIKEGNSYTILNSTPIHVYNKIKRKINAVTREKVNNLKVKCEIVVDKSIQEKYEAGTLLYIKYRILWREEDFIRKGKKGPVLATLFPGKQTFRLEPPFGQQQDIKVHVRPETERITLFLENGKIVSR